MFLPQGPEEDLYDSKGQQTDDINSLVEWVRVTLGYDKTADDEDDDNGNNFLLTKNCDIFIQQQQFQIVHERRFSVINKNTTFPEFRENTSLSTCLEVATPPPDFNT